MHEEGGARRREGRGLACRREGLEERGTWPAERLEEGGEGPGGRGRARVGIGWGWGWEELSL